MKKIFLMATFCLFFTYSFGQKIEAETKDGETIEVDFLENSPNDFPELWLGFQSGIEFGFGQRNTLLGLDLHYIIDNKFHLNADAFVSPLRQMDGERTFHSEGDVKDRIYYNTDLGLTWYMFQIDTKGKMSVPVQSRMSSSGENTEIIMLKTKVNMGLRFGLRGGYYYQQQGGASVAGGRTSIEDDNRIRITGITNHCLYGGFSVNLFQHVKTSSGGQTSSASQFFSLYFDILTRVAGEIDLAEKSFEPNDTEEPIEADLGYSKLPGPFFRVGLEILGVHPYINSAGVKFGFEYSKRPFLAIPVQEGVSTNKINNGYLCAKLAYYIAK